MRWALACLTCAWFGQAALAEIPVTSGEHVGFSRLVLDIGPQAGWTLETKGNSATLQINGRSDAFDLRRAFEKIPRARLLDLNDLGAGRLGLSLACPCQVEAYRFRRGYLVLDIADPDPEAAKPASPAESFAAPIVSPRVAPIALDTLADAMPAPPSLAGLDDQLAQQISKAAAQGVLDLVADPRNAPAPQGLVEAETDAATTKPERTAPPPPAMLQVQVDTQSSIDTSLRSLASALPALISAERCIPNSALDLGNWRDKRPFAVQVGELRTRLLTEFDRPTPDAARALARLYVAFGLGAEARAVLTSFSTRKDHPVLWDISNLLSHPSEDRGTGFAHQASCDGHAALWAVLTQTPGEEAWNIAAIQRGFSALPGDLRHHLAPPLAARLQAHGHDDTADAVLRIAGRGRSVKSPDLAFARAQLSPDDKASAKTLEAESRRNTPHAPAALIDLIDMRLAGGDAPDPGWIELTAAFAREHRGSALGDAMTFRHARVLAHATQFDAAFATLPPALPAPILSDMADQLTQSADDITFLKIALDQSRLSLEALAPETAQKLSARLAALGFGPGAGKSVTSAGEAETATAPQLGQFQNWISARPVPATTHGQASLAQARETLAEAEAARSALDDLLAGTATKRDAGS